MSKEEILKGNKLIASFMDIDDSIPHDHQGIYLYHSSWDWLMDVIKKIELLKIKDYNIRVSIDSVRCFISITHFYEGSIKIFYKNIYNDNDSKMERIYKLIIEFIKYYNKLNETN